MDKVDYIDGVILQFEEKSEPEKRQISAIVDKYLCITDSEQYSAVVIDSEYQKGDYIKLGNVCFKFKEALMDIFAGTKSAASLKPNELTFKNILLVIDIIIRLVKANDIKIGELECAVVAALYYLKDEEKTFDLGTIKREMELKEIGGYSEDEIRQTLFRLVEINCIYEKDEKYRIDDLVIIGKEKK